MTENLQRELERAASDCPVGPVPTRAALGRIVRRDRVRKAVVSLAAVATVAVAGIAFGATKRDPHNDVAVDPTAAQSTTGNDVTSRSTTRPDCKDSSVDAHLLLGSEAAATPVEAARAALAPDVWSDAASAEIDGDEASITVPRPNGSARVVVAVKHDAEGWVVSTIYSCGGDSLTTGVE